MLQTKMSDVVLTLLEGSNNTEQEKKMEKDLNTNMLIDQETAYIKRGIISVFNRTIM